MEINLVTILLLVIALLAGYFVSDLIKKKQQKNQTIEEFLKNYFQQPLEGMVKDLRSDFKDYIGTVEKSVQSVSKEVGESKVALSEKQNQMAQNMSQIYDAMSGSKKVGTSGEMMLENLLMSTGLIETKQWIRKQNFRKDGHTLQVECGIIEPSGLVLPIDSYWPKDAYHELVALRKKEDLNPENKKLQEKKLKEIVKKYDEKAKEVKKKYLDHPLSSNQAIIYCPSPSLFIELATYVFENNVLFIADLASKYKVTIMSPLTFYVHIYGLEMGFNTLSGEKKAQKFFQYIDGFEILIATHNENIEKLSNVVSTVSKYSDYFKKSGAKIQDEMKRIKEIINEVTDSKK